MTKASNFDWVPVKSEYLSGATSLRSIAASHGISPAGILKRARRDSWGPRGVVERKPVVLVPESAKREGPKPGFVYVVYIDTGLERLYKVGLSENFRDRMSSHQTSSPFELCVACAYFTGDMRGEERHLHTRFEDQRVRGEWFRLSHADLVELSARALLV